MEFVNKGQKNNAKQATECLNQEEVLNISQARPMLSSIVSNASSRTYLVGKRGVPDVVIMSYSIAKRYMPEHLISGKYYAPAKAGKRFVDFVESLPSTKSKNSKMLKTYANLSQEVDKIVYGI